MKISAVHTLAVTFRLDDTDTWEERLSWGVETGAGTAFQLRDSIAMTDPSDRPAFFRDDAGQLFWVVRDGRTHDRLRVFTARDTLIDLGTLAAPFHNSRVIGAPLPDGRLIVFTVSLNAIPGEPQAFSAATAFAVTCSTPPTRR